MSSDVPQGYLQCCFCDMNFKDRGHLVKHERHCKNNPDAHIRTESPGNAQKRTARIPVLPEQHVNNPASDNAQGSTNNDAPGFDMQTSQQEPLSLLETLAACVMATMRNRQPYPRKATFSDDEPGTSNPDQVLMACSDKTSSSVECYGGDERRGTAHPVVGVEEDLNQNVGCQGITSCVDDSDVIHKQEQKPDLSDFVVMQQQNTKANINIDDHKHPSVLQMQNSKLGLNLLPRNDSSDTKVPTPSVSSMDDLNALIPTDTNSDKEMKAVNGSVDNNIPEHRHSSEMQMQKEKLGLLLLRNDSSDTEVPTPSVSSIDDLNALILTDRDSDRHSDKEMKTVNGDQIADSFSHCPAQE